MIRLETIAARVEPVAYAALRVVSGGMLTFHGVQKILGWHATKMPRFGTQMWVGGVIELVGGALVAVGLFTRYAAFIASGMMAVAYTQFHWKLRFAGALWIPTLNGGELAALYAFVFLYIAARGPGVASLGARR